MARSPLPRPAPPHPRPDAGHRDLAPVLTALGQHGLLRLVAAGRSNRDIATELFISAKTASVHVSNILSKLGVTSRGEAAAAAHRLRLFDSLPPQDPRGILARTW